MRVELVGGGGGVAEEDDVGVAVGADDAEGFAVGGPAEVVDVVGGFELCDGTAFCAVERYEPEIVGAHLFGGHDHGLAVRGEVKAPIVGRTDLPKDKTAVRIEIEKTNAVFCTVRGVSQVHECELECEVIGSGAELIHNNGESFPVRRNGNQIDQRFLKDSSFDGFGCSAIGRDTHQWAAVGRLIKINVFAVWRASPKLLRATRADTKGICAIGLHTPDGGLVLAMKPPGKGEKTAGVARSDVADP